MHARRLAEAVAVLPDTVTAEVEREVLTRAGQQSVGQFSSAVRRAVLRHDTRSRPQRESDARTTRWIVFTPDLDGMWDIWARMPADDGLVLRAELERRARAMRGTDCRTADQRRVDALVDLASGVAPHEARAGVSPAVVVTVAASTLLGADEQSGDVGGFGPVPAAVARRLAADPTGTWHRLLTDAAGQPVELGATTYRPPVALARFVQVRDRTCRFPRCSRPATSCELDHLRAWSEGGTTTADNLQALCARHHHLKHGTRWQPEKLADGTQRWIAPTGHVYEQPPEPVPVPLMLDRRPTDRLEETASSAREPSPDDPPPF